MSDRGMFGANGWLSRQPDADPRRAGRGRRADEYETDEVKLALDYATGPHLDAATIAALSRDDATSLRAEAGVHARVLEVSVREARRLAAAERLYTPPAWLARAEGAVGTIRGAFARSEARLGILRDERRAQGDAEGQEARRVARNLAGEVERLQAENARLSEECRAASVRLHRAFFEVARIALAENTFGRILARARERVAVEKE